METKPVTSIQDFLKKYGTQGWRLPLEEFISQAPAFPSEQILAKLLGEFTADLQSALESEARK